jgi:hypothetical protein
MRRSQATLAVVFLFCVATGCGGSGTAKRGGDGGGADTGASLPDGLASDVVTPGPDSIASDSVPPGPDAGGAPEVSDAGPDVLAVDAREVGTDGSGSDATDAGPDVNGSDAVKMGPDGNPSDVPDSALDGNGSDAADAGADRRAADAADAGPDSRASEVGTVPPDGGTSPNEIIRACALAVSCASFSNTYSASRCIQEFGKTVSRQDDLKLERLLTCAKAANCSDFNGCWGGDLFTLDLFVTGGQCSGNSIEITPAGASGPQFLSCSAMGGVCEGLATDVISVACNAQSCKGTGVAPACDGTKARGCGGWAEYTSLDCAWSGRACQIQGSRAVCAGTGTACSDSDKVTCAGSVATYCSRGARATVDCAKTGFATRCVDGGLATEPCTAAGTECDPAAYVDECDGNKLKMCANGSIVSVACDDIGRVLCFAGSVGAAKCMPGT